MKNFERYTEEYTYTYNKTESYCYNMKNEMYADKVAGWRVDIYGRSDC